MRRGHVAAGEAAMATAELVTPSFRPDFAQCAHLCASVDAFAAPGIRHTVIVPRRDLPRFAPLGNARREVRAVEDAAPLAARQLPWFERNWILDGARFVRGRIVQQIVKIAVAAQSDAEAVVLADFDVFFVRPFAVADFVRDGRVRFHRATEGGHLFPRWNRTACRLLGIPERAQQDAGFVSPLACWEPGLVRSMCARIADASGRPWASAIARQGAFSEFATYGIFVEQVEAAAEARQWPAPPLCHVSWGFDLDKGAERDRFVDAVDQQRIAVCIHSNLGLPAPVVTDLWARIGARARADAQGLSRRQP